MKRTVLIVDDDFNIRELITLILTQAGYQVASASSGEVALDMMRRTRFSLVLLDVHMPRMSGLDVLGKMGRLLHAPPVLMVSANCAAETVSEAVGLGCSGYIGKPFAPATLLERVRRALAPPEPLLLD